MNLNQTPYYQRAARMLAQAADVAMTLGTAQEGLTRRIWRYADPYLVIVAAPNSRFVTVTAVYPDNQPHETVLRGFAPDESQNAQIFDYDPTPAEIILHADNYEGVVGNDWRVNWERRLIDLFYLTRVCTIGSWSDDWASYPFRVKGAK